jgi:hypothetical protein
MTIKERIINLVEAHKGIKATTLLSILSTEYIGSTKEEIKKELLFLLAEQKIYEIELIYSNNTNDGFLIPIGTEVRY